MRAGWVALALVAGIGAGTTCGLAQMSRPVGSVSVHDAAVALGQGVVVPASGMIVDVASGATVTAKAGHNASVALRRGGSVLVCPTTGIHVAASGDDSLQLAMDRGAVEVRMKARATDVILTPDLRFTLAKAGKLDLQMRVTFNGDTCVDNRGHRAPELTITDTFGETAYLLKPGQHVMFEHGSLKTVMDKETTPCGCPPGMPEVKGMSLADAALRGGQAKPMTPSDAAAAHPFPTAVSDGLAAPDPGPAAAVGERHVQVASTLRFDPSAGGDAEPAEASAVAAATPLQGGAVKKKHRPLAAIGHAFKRIFVR